MQRIIEDKDAMSFLQMQEFPVIAIFSVPVVLCFFRTSLIFEHGIKILMVHQKLCDCINHIRHVTSGAQSVSCMSFGLVTGQLN
jgi:hypothetical protein